MSIQDQEGRTTGAGPDKVLDHLERVRKELLGTSKRVRLINTPRHTKWAKTIEVVDELSDQTYSFLVEKGRKMSFLPHPELEDGQDEASADQLFLMEQPEDAGNGSGVADRHADNKLQTKLSSRKLQARLLGLYRDSQTLLDEQGISTLYLALGFLRWFEAAHSDKPLHSPLILIPVEMERKGANQAFKINYSGEDLWPNLPLQRRLSSEHRVALPELGDTDGFQPSSYFQQVTQAIRGLERWEVLPNDMVLGVFSFQKLLMYLDLDPTKWPEERRIQDHRLVRGFLGDGFDHSGSEETGEISVDEISHKKLLHILPADSSQSQAIEAVKSGKDLIIQGPPGTGKSQTITNLIAAAVLDGKRVLFLSQKKAALEVVHQKLQDLNLQSLCLELHSHKARKKEVLAELERTLNLQLERSHASWDKLSQSLDDLRRERNHLLEQFHAPIGATARSPYTVIGELVSLRLEGYRASDWALPGGVAEWSEEVFQRNLALMESLQERAVATRGPESHPWRGVGLTTVLPNDADRIRASVTALVTGLENYLGEVAELKRYLRETSVETSKDLHWILEFAKKVSKAPDLDLDSYAAAIWDSDRPAIVQAVQTGSHLAAVRAKLEPLLDRGAWDEDWSKDLRTLRAWQKSLFRWFKAEYRDANRRIKGFRLPGTKFRPLEVLDSLVSGQEALALLSAVDSKSATAFGSKWKGTESDWAQLSQILAWDRELAEGTPPSRFRELACALSRRPGLGSWISALEGGLAGVTQLARVVLGYLQLDLVAAFGISEIEELSLQSFQGRAKEWNAQPERISEWSAFRLASKEVETNGFEGLVGQVAQGRVNPDSIVDSFRYAIFESWLKRAVEERPALAAMDAERLRNQVARIQELEREHRELAVRRVAAAHLARVPNGSATIGEVGLIRKEAAKKRRHLPLRRLFAEAGRAIQLIKPVFMMSPLSVAQFMKPGQVEFDLLLIDEASQLPPEDALGAVARAQQIAVVGDDKQLPPTRFFDRLNEGEQEEDDENAADVESILGLANGVGLLSKMLRWHYRSRHESLIAVSNREFYDHRLFIPPSALSGVEGLGLEFRLVEGVYERGKTSANPIEAREVALAVMKHATTHPNQSLGVATFSVRQRDTILDELEVLRRSRSSSEPFFSQKGHEPFFVKNLEAVQGDQRDVMFISIGYGRDESGYMAMNFGPVAVEGGERRLNVLISRAKNSCVVFSSITGDDIDLQRAKSRGAQVLKTYLQYAQTGNLDIPDATEGDFESPFEEAVARRLTSLGYLVDTQVGVAGFRIDLAVRDPDRPGRYLLAVECDGAAYHSSRSARDRDVLREQVLRDRGWTVLRIWSADWLNHPDSQLTRIVEAIEAARLARPQAGADSKKSEASEQLYRDPQLWDSSQEHARSRPYETASFRLASGSPQELSPHDLLNRAIRRIVGIEKVIHIEELARRVASVWGLQRAGARILAATRKAVQLGLGKGLSMNGDFVQIMGLKVCPPRDRSRVDSPSLRQPRYLPPLEIATALRNLVRDHRGVARQELIREAARVFGFQRAGEQLQTAIADVLDQLVRSGELTERNGTLDLGL